MIDIHCHILPAVDDGPKTIKESLQMCEIAVNDGIKTIVATPHVKKGIYDTGSKEILKKVKELNSRLSEKNINLKILCGNDVHIQPNLIRNIDDGKILTINNKKKYIILELPAQSVPFYVEKVIAEFKKNKIKAIISHPERNHQIQKNINIVEKMIKAGALMQITAMSITGEFGSFAQTGAFNLLKRGLVHIIATDAHSASKRPPILSSAVNKASEVIGRKEVMKMVYETPLNIIKS